jgi:hypothetical protein
MTEFKFTFYPSQPTGEIVVAVIAYDEQNALETLLALYPHTTESNWEFH